MKKVYATKSFLNLVKFIMNCLNSLKLLFIGHISPICNSIINPLINTLTAEFSKMLLQADLYTKYPLSVGHGQSIKAKFTHLET